MSVLFCYWLWPEKKSVILFNLDEKNVNEVLTTVGAKPTPSVVKNIVDSCKGKKLDQLIAEGLKLVSGSVGSGGAAKVVAGGDAKPAAGKDEKKGKEEAKGGKDAGKDKGKDNKAKEKPVEKPVEKPAEDPEEEVGIGFLF